MAEKLSLMLCRYTVLGRNDVALSPREQTVLLEELRDAQPIAYRKRDPNPDDYDTYIMQPKSGRVLGHTLLQWSVVRDVRQRAVVRADRERGLITHDIEETDEAQTAKFFALPLLGFLAVEDRVGSSHLPAQGAVHRFAAIVSQASECEAQIEQAGTATDVQNAISSWSISEFSFQARPFNPHPSNPGDILSELMEKDEVGTMSGTARPKPAGSIRAAAQGLVREVLGLSTKGYATFGAKGTTPSGAEATVVKPKFSPERSRNLAVLSGPQKLRIQIDANTEDERELLRQIVMVILEFFHGQDRAEADDED